MTRGDNKGAGFGWRKGEAMTETREQKCADLARARGIPESEWLTVCFAKHHDLSDDAWCRQCNSDAHETEAMPPNPYESADDSRALVAWLAKRETSIKRRFVTNLHPGLSDACTFNDAPINEDMILEALTAPLPVIADAAWLALKGN